nr:AraC family transcriptional regulator [uncultured Sellimonas sp.]
MQIQTDKEKKELKRHGNYAFPVNLSMEQLARYEGGTFLWHWHTEIELTLILKGCIEYQVNDQVYHLKEGDALFCNSNAMHTGRRIENEDCQYLSTTFHPRFIYGYENSILLTKYVQPILNADSFSSLPFSEKIPWQKEVIDLLKQLYTLYLDPSEDLELKLHLILTRIWQHLYTYFSTLSFQKPVSSNYIGRLKEIMEFIHSSYASPITLEDIASHIHLSKSECCRFFKKHMNMTLFDYLLYYRILQSLPLLKKDNCSVSKAAEACGFSNSCYYSKIFKRYMHCSPKQYQNSCRHTV